MTWRFDPALLPPAPDLSHEIALWQAGFSAVAGIDEAGRGALAGPVTAAVLILPANPAMDRQLMGLRDSKQLSSAARATWAVRLRQLALAWGIGLASHAEIDRSGILPATRLAVGRALASIPVKPNHLLLDFISLPENPTPQTSLVKGDARSLSIAAASILAKTARDALMVELDRRYPGYSFAIHKGYGTRQHLAALAALGPCAVHRLSFAPLHVRNPAQPEMAQLMSE
jgi:ribonuclease HII